MNYKKRKKGYCARNINMCVFQCNHPNQKTHWRYENFQQHILLQHISSNKNSISLKMNENWNRYDIFWGDFPFYEYIHVCLVLTYNSQRCVGDLYI